jgi:hypothetical protein
MMVEVKSACLNLTREKQVSADTDHKQIAKIKKSQGGIYPTIKVAVRQGLATTARIIEAHPNSSTKVQPLAR